MDKALKIAVIFALSVVVVVFASSGIAVWLKVIYGFGNFTTLLISFGISVLCVFPMFRLLIKKLDKLVEQKYPKLKK